jgi:hypothetical protein
VGEPPRWDGETQFPSEVADVLLQAMLAGPVGGAPTTADAELPALLPPAVPAPRSSVAAEPARPPH